MNPDQYSSVVSSFTVKEDTTWGVWTPLKKVVDSSLAGGCKPDSTLAKWGIVDSALGAERIRRKVDFLAPTKI